MYASALFYFGLLALVYEVWPPAKTGIQFVHDNAVSDRRYQSYSAVSLSDAIPDGR